jgi:hypothetical protein
MSTEYKIEINEELVRFFDSIQYQGFSRANVLRDIKNSNIPRDIIIQIAIATALRGPKKASEILYGGKSISAWGVKSSVKPGEVGLSVSRICSAIPHVVVDVFRHFKVPKRIECECPAEYQFPAAAGVKMSKNLRKQHKEFAKKFSELLPNGSFSEVIYESAVRNEFDP